MRKQSRIRKLQAMKHGERVETGAVQFGDDWPGLFIRGDDCMGVARAIRTIAEQLGSAGLASMPVGSLTPLAEILEAIEKSVIVPN